MGYACPVCEAPQRDGEHLANHLAFTALLRGGDHEAWLDEHVPSWEDGDPDELAETVTDYAAAAEYDEVFEDTTEDHAEHVGGHGPQHQHGHGPGQGHQHGGGAGAGAGAGGGGGRPTPSGRGYDGTADQAAVDGVVAEARRLTAEMYGVDPDEVAKPDTDEVDPSDESGGDDADSGDADDADSDEA